MQADKLAQQQGRRPELGRLGRPQQPAGARLVARAAEGSVHHPAASSSSGSNSASGGAGSHPDALRRRLEQQRRQQERAEEMRAFSQAQWWQTDMPPNMVGVASPEEYRALVAERPLVVASFFVAWCTGCRRMSPKWRRIAANNPDITFVSVNCGEGPLQALAEGLGISILPYFRFYRGGKCRTHLAANLTRIDRLRAELAFLRSADSGPDPDAAPAPAQPPAQAQAADGEGPAEEGEADMDLSGALITPGLPGLAPEGLAAEGGVAAQ